MIADTIYMAFLLAITVPVSLVIGRFTAMIAGFEEASTTPLGYFIVPLVLVVAGGYALMCWLNANLCRLRIWWLPRLREK